VNRSRGSGEDRRSREDVRLRGFRDRATLEEALAWVDARGVTLGAVEVPLEEAGGRVVAAAVVAAKDMPEVVRAGIDGYAVRAADTVGASPYNPLSLRLELPGAGGAVLVAAGCALPSWADAVLGFDAAQESGSAVEAVAAVAEGAGVEPAGQGMRAGAPALRAGGGLGPRELALLGALGLVRVGVVARPRVGLVVAGPKDAPGECDANGPALRALARRDGGIVEKAEGRDLRAALRLALGGAPDVVLVSGRTGTGPDDEAPLALAECGRLELHGVALRPGGSVGMGVAGGVPVVLLPGDPLACLVAYELVAGRMVRRLAGHPPDLPHARTVAEVARKIVSAVGVVEVCQVRLSAAGVEPLGVAEFGGLGAAVRADGFVVVPAALEGYAPGARVTVHLH
jgi:molybdopterin molybdotransferase